MIVNLALLFTCREFAQKLASALAHNPNSGLHTINLAGNPLEDRGTVAIRVITDATIVRALGSFRAATPREWCQAPL